MDNNPMKGKFDDAKKTAFESGKLIFSGFGGSVVGSTFLGKYSLLAGIPLTVYGVYKKNNYIIAAGLGMAVGSPYKELAGMKGLNGAEDIYGIEDGMQGFSVKDYMAGAKARFSNWLAHNKAKITLGTIEENVGYIGEAPDMSGFGRLGDMPDVSGYGQIGDAYEMSAIGAADDVMGAVEEMPVGAIGTFKQPTQDGQMMVGISDIGTVY